MEYTEQYEGIYFNPLPPYGGRPQVFGSCQISCSISIHSLRMEGDQGIVRRPDFFLLFQSTPSVWRETYSSDRQTEQSIISIHSLRMEGDLPAHVVRFRIPYFNPLPPYGGRRQCRRRNDGHNRFQSTPSVWRETSPIFSPNFSPSGISIHSLRMEGDYDSACPFPGRRHFNPLPPYGGRPISKS